MTERGPLVLAVDDAHWADEPSLRFLLHLAHRLAGLPVTLALAVRTGSERHREDLGPLMLEARPPVLRPRPLGEAAVASLVRASMGENASSSSVARVPRPRVATRFFCPSCSVNSAATPGRSTPSIRRRCTVSRPSESQRQCCCVSAGWIPQAPALARAAAVLGEQARLSLCARLAGLDGREAARLAASLVDLAVLAGGEPLRFVHPIVRTAIYNDLTAAEQADLHARAARLLAEERADPGAIALHLLATPPTGDHKVVAMLREAARSALAGGAPDTAALQLRRALDEPPDAADRPAVLFELGNAEHEIGDAAAPGHLQEAGETATDPLLRARAFMALAWTTHPDSRRQRQQLPLYEWAAREVRDHDRELALQLDAARLGALMLNPDLPTRFEDEADRFTELPALTAGECLLRSFVARRALEGGPVSVAGDLAEEAAAHPALVSQGGHPLWRTNITICLVEAERYEVAEHILSRAMRHAERNGSPQWLARAQWLRGLARHRRGDLRGAEADARAAVDIVGPPTTNYIKTPGLVVVLDSLADQGRTDEGEALMVERGMDGELVPTLFSVLPLLARGRLRAAAGDHVRARADFELALEWMARSRGTWPWRCDACVALIPVLRAMGDQDAARAVVDQAMQAATVAQSPRRLGGALRVAGLVEGGDAGLELLRQAAGTLATSPALLWRAEAFIDLGAALRSSGTQ